MDMITAAEFEREMKKIKAELDNKSDLKDFEKAHVDADNLLCKVLKSLGYDAGVKVYEELEKFYE